uniref:Homeobox domain-containing protein n=2 Tax=Schistocephalus solidus TaxID=70667 RepID=A0A183SCW2_SCHSO
LLTLTVEQIEIVTSEVFNYLSDNHNNQLLNSVDNSTWLTKIHKDLSHSSSFLGPASFAILPRSPSLSTIRDGSVSSTATTQTHNHCKKGRTRLSSNQLSILWANFNLNNSPSDEKVAEICLQTGLKEKVVKHWFRNTLFKERQRSKDSPYNFSIPPTTNLDLEKYERTGKVETWPATPTKIVATAKTDSCEVAYVEKHAESLMDLRTDHHRATITEVERSCATSPSGRIREMKREYKEVNEVMMKIEAEEGEGRNSKGPSPSPSTSSEKEGQKKRLLGGKRIRTAISQSQQILLSRFFHNDPNPSRRQMDIIAGTVSLPKRVVQVSVAPASLIP